MRALNIIKRRRPVAVAVALAALAAPGVARAAWWDPYYGCYDAQHFRMSDPSSPTTDSGCPAGMSKLVWHILGDEGDKGGQGPKGPVGSAGPPGPQGLPGKYEQHWVVTKADTSNSWQAA